MPEHDENGVIYDDHLWRNKLYQEENGKHVRECITCEYYDSHDIKYTGNFKVVGTEDVCRLPVCDTCGQTVDDADFDYCHIINAVPDGTDTHKTYCTRCNYVFAEKTPCFDVNDWYNMFGGENLTIDDRIKINERWLHDNDDGTTTVTCACGNTKTVNLGGKITDSEDVDLEIDDNGLIDAEDKDVGYVDSLTEPLDSDDRDKLLESIRGDEALKAELEAKQTEAGIESLDEAQITAETEKAEIKYEAPITEGEGDNKQQTMNVDVSKKYQLTFTVGDKSFSMDTGIGMIVNTPTSICIPAPDGFGKDGDVVKVDHTHGSGNHVYYGKVTTFPDPNGNPSKVIMWTSQYGLSPFKLTISKAVDEEYKAYLLAKANEKYSAIVFSAPTAKTLTYNGSAQELVTAGEAEGGTMMYALGKDATTIPTSGWDTAIPTATGAGTYYVWYKVLGDSSHNDTAPVMLTVKIKKSPDNCTHQNTEIRGAKPATTTAEGYTGDKYCKDCDSLLEKGKPISIVKSQDQDVKEQPSSGGDSKADDKAETEKAANTLSVKAKTVKIKAADIKKKAKKYDVKKIMTVSKAQGTVTYKLKSVTKSKFKKYFKVDAKTGKLTVKKKLKKGTYKVKINVIAAGNDSYKPVTKTVTVKVKVS